MLQLERIEGAHGLQRDDRSPPASRHKITDDGPVFAQHSNPGAQIAEPRVACERVEQSIIWEEAAVKPVTENCEEISAGEVVTQFANMSERILGDAASVDARAVAEFGKVIGKGRYLECQTWESGNRTFSKITEYRAVNGRYSIRFTLGFED